MISNGMTQQRHFIGLNSPLAPAVADWLIDRFGGRPLDLSAVAVVVPTANSGRLLRAALAAAADTLGTGLLAPMVITPDRFDALLVADTSVAATRLECELAWIQVLTAIDFKRCNAVFPIQPKTRGQIWAIGVAKRMVELRRLLGEGGLSISDAARHPATAPEQKRWQQLASLEGDYQQVLAAAGRVDPFDRRSTMSVTAPLQPSIHHIVLAAVADPIPQAVTTFARLAEHCTVEVLIAADKDDAERFDDWGIPRPGAWSDRITIPSPEDRIHLCHNPSHQGERAAAILRASAGHIGSAAVGVCDPEVFHPLANALNTSGMSAYDPGGEPVGKNPIITFLQLLRNWIRDDSVEALAEFLRDPALAAFCTIPPARKGETEMEPLALFEDFYRDHLPVDLSAAAAIAEAPGVKRGGGHRMAALLGRILELRDSVKPGAAFSPSLRKALAAILETLPAASTRDPSLQPTIKLVVATADELSGTFACAQIAVPDLIDLILQEITRLRLPLPHPEQAVVCYGWLETLWVPHAHLVLAGCNDGKLPAAVPHDDFLPNTLRQALGLPSDDSRFERDCYLVRALIAQRGRNGRIDFIAGRNSSRGEALLPSRLLLLENEALLPARVEQIFREPPVPSNVVATSKAWDFTPPRAEKDHKRMAPSAVSVTALSAYLACPFRYYLKHVLKMQLFDPHKQEMDARDFGNVIHDAIEHLNSNPDNAGVTDESEIRERLLSRLEDYCQNAYGKRHSLAMQVQLDSARERLSHAARALAGHRASGWFPAHVEWRFHEKQPFIINGVEIHGRIDLIEEHRETGRWRLIDFKSSESPKPPDKAHCKRLTASSSAAEIAVFSLGGKDYYWTNLQLPLYVLAVQATTGRDPQDLEVGYFNLPRAVNQTGFSPWQDCADYIEAAAHCTAAIIEKMTHNVYWPPNKQVLYDDFEEWFPPDLESACAQFEEVCK